MLIVHGIGLQDARIENRSIAVKGPAGRNVARFRLARLVAQIVEDGIISTDILTGFPFCWSIHDQEGTPASTVGKQFPVDLFGKRVRRVVGGLVRNVVRHRDTQEIEDIHAVESMDAGFCILIAGVFRLGQRVGLAAIFEQGRLCLDEYILLCGGNGGWLPGGRRGDEIA